SYEGLSLKFRDGQFVGYFAEPPYVPETTRAAMLTDENISLVDVSTIGEEFVMGSDDVPVISGLFDGEGDDASVQALYAGENCIAR
ncbi:MAG: hypothetical protein WA957_05675, partial [Alteraurantiacibacter sp.]